jgi:hypothetical protein
MRPGPIRRPPLDGRRGRASKRENADTNPIRVLTPFLSFLSFSIIRLTFRITGCQKRGGSSEAEAVPLLAVRVYAFVCARHGHDFMG